eukprot:scaffold2214_cov128-Isochrysis_galbana.AAC.7
MSKPQGYLLGPLHAGGAYTLYCAYKPGDPEMRAAPAPAPPQTPLGDVGRLLRARSAAPPPPPFHAPSPLPSLRSGDLIASEGGGNNIRCTRPPPNRK